MLILLCSIRHYSLLLSLTLASLCFHVIPNLEYNSLFLLCISVFDLPLPLNTSILFCGTVIASMYLAL